MLTLGAVGIARDAIALTETLKTVTPASQELVDVSLVSRVPENNVTG
jgi:hypothetical protein